MSPENTTPNTTKICPTCGTRLGINATRCSVCGSTLSPSVAVSSSKAVSAQRVPAITLSLPALFGLGVLFLAIGAVVVFAVLRSMGGGDPADAPIVAAVDATITPTHTTTATITMTPTETLTPTPEPTWTLEPPIEYKVAQGDTCGGIAFTYGVSVSSIAVLNGLNADCSPLSVGQVLKIPRPTPTPSPQPTATLNATEAAKQECETVDYIVKDGDTMGGIAGNYGVSSEAIMAFNNKSTEIVFVSEKLVIPLCEQRLEPPTATPIPPYAAPNLLLPADGAAFTNPSEAITLQWASVGELRQNEVYAVTVEDVTENNARKWVNYVADTKFTLPEGYRPASTTPHIYRWTVLTVRQTNTDKDSGQPVYEPAGTVSIVRTFTWVGTGEAPPQPEPGIQPSQTPTTQN